MVRLRLSRPIRKRRSGKLITPFLTKQPEVKKKKVLCIGGPYDGEKLKLTDESGYLHSAWFSVESYNNNERGRYVVTDKAIDAVKWEIYNDSKDVN